MQSRFLTPLLPIIYNAALEPQSWPSVMAALCKATGAVGGGYIVQSKLTNRIIHVYAHGIPEDIAADYRDRFSQTDPYWSVFEQIKGVWLPLTDIRKRIDLSRNEWYNDFISRLKITELLGSELAQAHNLAVAIGLQFRRGVSDKTSALLNELREPLAQAARLDVEIRMRRWQADIAADILAQQSLAVVVISDAGRIVEANPVAEQILGRADGLTVRQGRVVPGRVFERTKLDACLTSALSPTWTTKDISRMIVGRPSGRRPYTLTIIPSTEYPGAMRKHYAILLIADPEAVLPSATDLAQLYGMSPAESRLAASLAAGKRLAEISSETGIKMTTLRTQVRSILRKVGVGRQADLLPALSSGFLGRGSEPNQG